MSTVQDKNNEHFNSKAHEYDQIPKAKEMTAKASEVILDAYASATSPEHVKNSTVLDFGCGTGLAAFIVAERVKELVGVDASEGMLAYLHKKLDTLPELASLKASNKIHTVCHLVTNESPLPEPEMAKYLESPNGGFDMVFSNYVFHHIEDYQSIIDAMAKKLVKKDGWVIIIDFEGHHVHGGVDHGKPHHGHAHGHDHGHAHGHDHGHHHHHHEHKEGDAHAHEHGHHHHHHEEKGVKVDDIYKDENGKPLEYVAHKGGFSPEIMTKAFEKAGLVDITAARSFGFERDLHGKTIWTDVLIAKGRRP
ncbi:hypothetical protein FBU30_009861 [Linnemannia zychae]|nr:hypothetical protein FBU30_009861 [Linnemannia zychae]